MIWPPNVARAPDVADAEIGVLQHDAVILVRDVVAEQGDRVPLRGVGPFRTQPQQRIGLLGIVVRRVEEEFARVVQIASQGELPPAKVEGVTGARVGGHFRRTHHIGVTEILRAADEDAVSPIHIPPDQDTG